MTYEEQIKRLKELIAIELDSCKLDKHTWPYVCHMASDPESYKSIEQTIINMCEQSGCTIQYAIDRIERAYNPNRMED